RAVAIDLLFGVELTARGHHIRDDVQDQTVKRLAHLDWLRGLAVLIMILWHSMDAWTAPSARRDPAFNAIAFIGGWAAPLFLFLAGVALPLASEARRGQAVR